MPDRGSDRLCVEKAMTHVWAYAEEYPHRKYELYLFYIPKHLSL